MRVMPWTEKMLRKVLKIDEVLTPRKVYLLKLSVISGFSNTLYDKNAKKAGTGNEQKTF